LKIAGYPVGYLILKIAGYPVRDIDNWKIKLQKFISFQRKPSINVDSLQIKKETFFTSGFFVVSYFKRQFNF
jgi:hypothetical protein